MARLILLLTGIGILIMHNALDSIPEQWQYYIFFIGILVLGIPHGAADLLVANENATYSKTKFSKIRFFIVYLGRLSAFAALLWFFPITGNLLFILFAAYHFGETDLHHFKTNTLPGKIFALSYGLLILSVLLLVHVSEIKSMLAIFNNTGKYNALIDWIAIYRFSLLSAVTVLFFSATFVYFLRSGQETKQGGDFLLHLALILFILYHLPLIMGFTFYFIIWHSVLSLKNILGYLHRNGRFSLNFTLYQITLYSFLALLGITAFGLTGLMFVNTDAIVIYIFLGLAVLTAPHMQVMQDMYKHIRGIDSGTAP